MLNWFKQKSKEDLLMEKYKKLLEEAYKLSTTSRTASDKKQAEAQEVLEQLETLKKS